ncbi:MAG: sigma-54-dependent Fis family transcriptional regulator [Verrucomicrobia bacterium]|nr:sigma-54-dependent Fis family transcriptional regulator [Verrucomicrobiota bacterium]
MNLSRIHILVVDDERALCAGLQEALRREGYSVDTAHDAPAALKRVEARLYNLVVTDVRLPGSDGLQLLREVRQRSPDTQFIVMTAYGTVENAVTAMKDGAYDYLLKPVDVKRLRAVVVKALELQAVVAENSELRERLRKRSEQPTQLVGESEAVRRLVRTAEEVARSDVTVLLEGESGTGKELVARLIHNRSPRAARPFIFVNCAALTETLVEAELFGHARGSFTGAIADKPGRFHLADGGTLFLDEIGDLGPKGQGDLLRVLEDGMFRMVGGTALQRVDVRIIAATNKNLAEAVATQKFREDLYYRLQIVPILVPPLRDRADDIPLLIESFLEHFAAKYLRRRKQLSGEALQLCQRFPWPGNVRQLRNVVERLVVTCPDPVIGVEALPEFLHTHDREASTFAMRVGMTLAEAEKLLIRQTLSRLTSNREEAARALGVSRRTLQYKLKRYGLLDSQP